MDNMPLIVLSPNTIVVITRFMDGEHKDTTTGLQNYIDSRIMEALEDHFDLWHREGDDY